MGLLGSLLSNILTGGIKEGIGTTIGKVVEDIIKPSVDQPQHNSTEGTETDKDATAATSAGEPTLGSILGRALRKAEPYLKGSSRLMKVCPDCYEGCTADNAFCPSCGAALGAGALDAAYTCRNCDHVNPHGTINCQKCGSMLPGPEAAEKKVMEEDEDVLNDFIRVLPQYPVWSGGMYLRLEQNGERCGHPVYTLSLDSEYALLRNYIAKLLAAGFKPLGNGNDSDLYYKVIDGQTYCFSCTDAYRAGSIWVGFYVDNSIGK